MAKSFFAIQAAERRKIWLITAFIFLVYFAAFFLITFGLASLLEPTIQKALTRSLPTAFILAVAVLAIQLWFADRHGMRVILEGLSAKPPDPEDHYHQRVIRVTDEIAVAAGGVRVKPVIVPTLAANAFALADHSHAVIGVTEGAVSGLTRDQTQALIAHEMAHIVNQDCRAATWVCAMAAPFIALADALEKLEEEEDGFRDQAASAGVRAIVALLTFSLSRKRELRADAKAIELTRNPSAMAETLYRVSTGDHFIGGTAGSLAPIFIVPSQFRPIDERESPFADLFSSHPPTEKRLKTLLGIASLSRKELIERVETAPRAAPVESIESQLAEQQEWQIRSGDEWNGPFRLAALIEQPGFGPQAWIRHAGSSTQGIPAYSDPLINSFLRQARSGHSVVGLCPRCNIPLAKTIYEGLPVGKCQSCAGYLVAEMRVERLLKRREIEFSEEFQREVDKWLEKHSVAGLAAASSAAEGNQARCLCPQCKKPMFRGHYSYQYFIPVDRCMNCHQIWFDAKEIEILQALVERKQDANAKRAVI